MHQNNSYKNSFDEIVKEARYSSKANTKEPQTLKQKITMKKLLIAVAVIAMVCSFSSCKKKCNCTTTMNGQVMQTVTMEATNCSKLNVTQTVGDMVQETKCN